MCNKLTIAQELTLNVRTIHTDIPSELLTGLFGLAEPPPIAPRYNIATTQMVPVIRQYADGQNHLDHLRWGLIPSWTKDKRTSSLMINARSETVSEKPAFKQSVRYRRCVVVASGFFEWTAEVKVKLPWYIRLKDGSPMMFAGLWDSWKSPEGEVVESCNILTTAPNRSVEPLHGRMPVILHLDDYRTWLDRQVTNPTGLVHLFQPYPADLMEMWPVLLVNNVRNDSADLVVPVGDATNHDPDTSFSCHSQG